MFTSSGPRRLAVVPSSTTISVFDTEGRSHTFKDVQVDTVSVRTIGHVGSFKVLSFKTLEFRTVNVIDVAYWVVDEKAPTPDSPRNWGCGFDPAA